MPSFIQSIIKKQLYIWFPEEEILENYRPEWLVGLEIDLYLPNLNLAIEVNGLQHLIKCEKFFKTNKDFEMQIIKDYVKKKIIFNESINFISIKQGANMLNEFTFKINYFIKKKLKINETIKTDYKSYWNNNRDSFIKQTENFRLHQVSLLENEYLFSSMALKNKKYKEFYDFVKSKAYINQKNAQKKMDIIYGN